MSASVGLRTEFAVGIERRALSVAGAVGAARTGVVRKRPYSISVEDT
jgi:tRNA U34 5-methylaminomethyl-2-thiouridine-forming methyltransferase MnmC